MLQSGSWYFRLCASLALILFLTATTHANPITLAWDPSSSDDVTGYTVRYGTSPGLYSKHVDAGNTTSLTLPTLPNGTYYFVVQAYSSDGYTSNYSNQLVVTVGSTAPVIPSAPIPQPGGCSTPDPFLTLGGGMCHSGAWLPPGMLPPTTSSPAPAPSTPAPPPSASGCKTPDPFVTIGGGVCINGGWVPAGMVAPKPSTPAPAPVPPKSTSPSAPAGGGACTTPDPFVTIGGGACVNGGWVPAAMVSSPSGPAPKPPTQTAPAPSAPPPASGGGACTIPDPFATIGGGTCYNGGWLPPGMAVPGGGTTAPPVPAPKPPAPPTLTGCITPDPFVSLGGGTCYGGAWLPPGMEPPGTTDDEVTVTGTLHVLDAENGVWVLEAEDGTLYTAETELPEEILVNGAILTLHGTRVPLESDDQEVVVVEIISIGTQG